MTMAESDHTVALHRAAPYRTVLRPALGVREKALDKPFRHPSVMSEQRQIDVYQRVSRREPCPCGRDAAESVDHPAIAREQIGVRFEILLVRNLAAAGSELDRVDGIERESSQLGQSAGQCRLAAAGISKEGDLFHGAGSMTCARLALQDTGALEEAMR